MSDLDFATTVADRRFEAWSFDLRKTSLMRPRTRRILAEALLVVLREIDTLPRDKKGVVREDFLRKVGAAINFAGRPSQQRPGDWSRYPLTMDKLVAALDRKRYGTVQGNQRFGPHLRRLIWETLSQKDRGRLGEHAP